MEGQIFHACSRRGCSGELYGCCQAFVGLGCELWLLFCAVADSVRLLILCDG